MNKKHWINNRLLKDLVDYNHPGYTKARRVYLKCIRSGRIAIADRINEKFGPFKTNTDMVTAIAISMNSMQLSLLNKRI